MITDTAIKVPLIHPESLPVNLAMMLFVLVETLWLGAAAVGLWLTSYTAAIYEGASVLPFTTHLYWHILPFTVALLTAADYVVCHSRGDRKAGQLGRRRWIYPLLILLGVLYLLLCFLPLNIIVTPPSE